MKKNNISQQVNFFEIVSPPRLPIDPIDRSTVDAKDRPYATEEQIADMHFKFQSRKRSAQIARNRFDAATANREFKEFLKNIGAMTDTELRHFQQEAFTPPLVEFFQLTGIWDKMQQDGMTPEVIGELGQLIADSAQIDRDPHSSEGFTFYGTEAAMLADQAGLDDIPLKKIWVEEFRRRTKEG